MILTPTQLSRLEKLVYPGKIPAAEFYPSLEGSELQRLQALDVIVAAFNLPNVLDVSKTDGKAYFVLDDHENQCTSAVVGDDLLHAASMAVLA